MPKHGLLQRDKSRIEAMNEYDIFEKYLGENKKGLN
jgi:hypothetical protein